MPAPLSITISRLPDPRADALYAAAIWGSPGGLRYRTPGPFQWDWLPNHHLLLAHREGQVVGGYVITPRKWGFLRTLLAVHPQQVGTGVGRALVAHAHAVFTPQLTKGQVMLGTIEHTNARSLSLSRRHYQEVGRFEILTITRRWPGRLAGCRRGTLEEFTRNVPETGVLWNDLPQTFDPSGAFVLTRDGEPVAGVVARVQQLHLLALPGLQTLYLALLPLLLGTPRSVFRYVALHHWWGDPADYGALWTHAMAEMGVTAAMATGDVTSPLWPQILAQVPRGLAGRLVPPQSLAIMATGPLPGPIAFTPLFAA